MQEKKTKFSVNDLTQIAMSAVVITVCSWISIPASIPFTLQTFAICLITAVFGLRKGTWSVLIYILLGLVGVPVFSGFRGGLGVLLGNTGGYIIGFIFTALIVGWFSERWHANKAVLAAAMVLGIAVCYAFGTAWFVIVYTKNSGAIGVMTALAWCVFPYLIPDAVKIAAAVLLTERLRKLLRKE
ncbi:MAG: biotin transporter BioY [Oscillospiraceae bacterium]|nr:biotin transporter BioY [Oscillospiraceae bacterium]